jgi:malate synthase
MVEGVQVVAPGTDQAEDILSDDALTFLVTLARSFEIRRQDLMNARIVRQIEIDNGDKPNFLNETRHIRESDWVVPSAPSDLSDRKVEITGPSSNRRMVINALNSGAQVYMTDFEDANSPGWIQNINGQRNVRDAALRTINEVTPEGREYKLNERTSVLCVRPRGLHLKERHVLVDGQPISASLFDFGLAFFHNATNFLENGSGSYFYLPKLQSHLEARWWNEVFNLAQDELGIQRGSIRATVLIEHILAAFEMDEILYELREHITALNLGRWDYIYSIVKVFRNDSNMVLPDRGQVTMATHFLQSAAELLTQTCHRRGAHAMGGMSAFIPRRDDVAANDLAMAQVRLDKEREAQQGFDGAWIAHPGLLEVVSDVFGSAFDGDNQISRINESQITADDLLSIPKGQITEAGIRGNINITLQYIDAWIQGTGAVAINYLMEDAATAEISRSQLWQWMKYGARTAEGNVIDIDYYRKLRSEEVSRLQEEKGMNGVGSLDRAIELLDRLVESPELPEFLTIPAYGSLE